ncbi:MAG: NAD-dependent epimerase/dehydratase family protein [Acidobacteria bacterium]|nr:NAD-dependent epimerase/dehydratase family protein [Acidobacteriota bacterium]MBI3656242.1 NAD-dependent epimerase/dehydratase family protein [Acidobacteriota bacterium]
MNILVTGGAGLVGSECCRLFASQGHSVISVDNYMRGKIFGNEGNTQAVIEGVLKDFSQIKHLEADIRDTEKMTRLIAEADVIIHAASQPSHPRSIEIPMEDFSINAYGTLNLLEITRQHNPKAVFIFCSSNKVYGDKPNELPIIEKDTRYDFRDIDAIDETMSIDYCMHTPFGISKVAGDLYTQEYARLYGLKTGAFRMGCITGGAAQAVELHNWEPFFVRKNLTGELLRIYGYKGKQVRDVIHARDLALLFKKFAEAPRPGEVYNIGGGRKNSISLLEAIKLIEGITGKRMKYEFAPEREADHKVYISDISKARAHYDWDIKIGLQEIFEEIVAALNDGQVMNE